MRDVSIIFSAQQWGNYGSLDATISLLGSRLELSDPEVAEALRNLQNLQAHASALEIGLSETVSGETVNQDVAESYRETLVQLDAAGREMAESFPELAGSALPSIVPLDKTQALLDPGEALVMFGRGMEDDDGLYSWLVTNTEVNFKRVEVSRKKLKRLIALARPKEFAAISDDACLLQQKVGLGEARSVDLCAAHDLYKILFGEHQNLLRGVKNLFVVTGDEISDVPFHSLLTQEARPSTQPAWLARDMAVTWLPTVTTLEVMRSTKLRGGVARKPFFGIAPVEFDDFRLVDARGRSGTLQPLGGTFAEVNEVADLLGSAQSDLKLEGQATEAFVKSADLRAYDVVSFATHGLKASEVGQLTQNKISQPALLLRPDGKEDGILTSAEAAGLLLDANWVILSACNTAAGEGQGAVGLSGLARSFFFAGARSLLVSHWAADDDASVAFMSEALSNWKRRGLSKSEAVRQARLSIMQKPGWEHPYYWSVFSLVGDNH